MIKILEVKKATEKVVECTSGMYEVGNLITNFKISVESDSAKFTTIRGTIENGELKAVYLEYKTMTRRYLKCEDKEAPAHILAVIDEANILEQDNSEDVLQIGKMYVSVKTELVDTRTYEEEFEEAQDFNYELFFRVKAKQDARVIKALMKRQKELEAQLKEANARIEELEASQETIQEEPAETVSPELIHEAEKHVRKLNRLSVSEEYDDDGEDDARAEGLEALLSFLIYRVGHICDLYEEGEDYCTLTAREYKSASKWVKDAEILLNKF